MNAKEAIQLLEDLISNKKLIRIIFSEQDKNAEVEWNKVVVRPVKIKDNELMQFEKFKENKSYHFNMEIESMHEEIAVSVGQFQQMYIQSEG